MRYETREHGNEYGYPTYCVWDTELNQIVEHKDGLIVWDTELNQELRRDGLIAIYTGKKARELADERTAELNSGSLPDSPSM